MLAWQIDSPDWYALARSERAFKKAIVTAKSLIEAMLQHDMSEEAKRKAEEETRRRGRRR